MRTASGGWFVFICICCVPHFPASAQDNASPDRLISDRPISARRPVQRPTIELRANHPANVEAQSERLSKKTTLHTLSLNPWQTLATLPGAVVHDLSFPTPTVGFAAAELGQVWKTADGGSTWTEVMNLGAPYYWYGVHALDPNNVIISGFNDQSGMGVARWSQDGGSTWTGDLILGSNWSVRPRFATSTQGLILDSITGPTAHYTTDGGATAADWTQVTVDPSGGWFGDEFSLLSDLKAAASGINYCSSSDGGQTWTCGPSVDSVFDGPTLFVDDNNGWVGGGSISPTVEGWIHRTTDGGQSWSGRVLDGPLPIREILFLSPTMGWAAGGNIYTSVGGIYFSSDGGQTWSLDVDSVNETDACDTQPVGGGYQVWCAGYNNACSIYGDMQCASTVYGVTGAATPTFTPSPQTFNSSQVVTVSDSTTGATIYYTTDGSTPTTASAVYAAPIAVTSTTTLQGMAVSTSTAPSLIATGLYTITPVLEFAESPPPITVSNGSPGTGQFKLMATANAPNVSFSCSGLPSGAQCSFAPSTVNATTTPTNVTLTISTTSFASMHGSTGPHAMVAMMLAGFLVLPLNVLVKSRSRLAQRRPVMCVGFLLVLALALAGCGSSSQTAQVTVTASATGATSATTQVQVTINH